MSLHTVLRKIRCNFRRNVGTSCPAFTHVATVVVGGILSAAAPDARAGKWAVCYSSECEAQALGQYDIAVLDATSHPPLSQVRNQGAKVFGYISIGEIEAYRDHYAWARRENLIVRENPNWPENYLIDIRRDVWLEKLIYDLVPEMIRKGFDGLMLDTVDSSILLEREQPEQFAGMNDAAVRIIRSLDRHFPDTELILNRGYEVLARVGGAIDYALGESVYTDYDFETDSYSRRSEEAYRWQVDRLSAAAEANPDLQVLTLDYWQPDDRDQIREIYRIQRANGFWPYVATVDLQSVIPEPSKADVGEAQ